ncbi:MAG: phosphoenolpyruvate--protein phosphotransferase [Bifidobacterium aquikefiri]|uniref:Phosphoenolpyruvate-protein phosphotransferase n=1 Tax=Bifidobacterium aquikefiri TaxID=1653207 RepID=A0A261GAP1_9BIFI|nr:phosphoenolpyruvate--protein phosphotransferase [Bifidobacterium aquikefiri]OZG68480.1 phosphoenolpyruvate--protein phosphotransferase [Bifidobacterium aquikefiri]
MNIQGTGIGRGVATGRILRVAPALKEPEDVARNPQISDEDAEQQVLSALEDVKSQLEARAEQASKASKNDEISDILGALAQMAADPALIGEISKVVKSGKTPERAVFDGFGEFEAKLEALGGYMAERAKDLHDVGQRVIALLTGAAMPGIPEGKGPSILLAEDLSPADTASLDLSQVLGIITIQGSPTSHTAILARSRGIVAIVGAQKADSLHDGDTVILNAAKNVIVLDPSDDDIEEAEHQKRQSERARLLRGKPGATKDDVPVALLANVGKPEDANAALEHGAEGVGLFRTEFMFISSSQSPSVEDQTKAYVELLRHFPHRKVVIRMLDAGADKPMEFLTPENEPNPALGLRGLRTLRAHRQVLDDQLEALARANEQTDADLWVMAPMVADEHEADFFVKLGKAKGIEHVGAMAEVPSIALMANEVAKVADFVSIGTNDLTQYTLAADRTLASVGAYQTAWHPAVLRAIKLIADAGKEHDMPVGVCGEAAADPDLALVLVGLGVTSLSMAPVALDDVRANLAEHTFEETQKLASRALAGEFYPQRTDE